MTKTVIVLTGQAGSGKDTMSKYLVEEYGATKVMYSSPFREMLRALAVPETRENLSLISVKVREAFGQDALSKAIVYRVHNAADDLVIVDGARRMEDIQRIAQEAKFTLVAVDASIDTRYNRIVKRGQNADDAGKTMAVFEKEAKLETEASIVGVMDQATVRINNDGGLEELKAQCDAFMASLGKSRVERILVA